MQGPQVFKGMTIALIGPLPPPSGGMANQTRQLAHLLEQDGARVEIVRINAAYRPNWVGSLRGIRAVFRLVPFIVNLWNAAARVQLFHIMANSGWAWHLCAAPAVWIGKLRGIPVVVNYRGGAAEDFFNRSISCVRPTLRAANGIVVPSMFLQQVFGRFHLRAEIVPNIIDLGRFVPRKGRAVSTLDQPHIIVTRNLEAIYDVATALRAVAIVRKTYSEVRMTIAGEGPERAGLEMLAQSLGLAANVKFAGRLDNFGIETLYQKADVFLNPSLVDNMPISILEALASGVPVVSTRVGGVPFLVEDQKTALLVPPANAEAMAQAMLELLGDEARAQKLVHAGRECVQQYAWQNVRAQWFEVYERLTRRPMQRVAAPAE